MTLFHKHNYVERTRSFTPPVSSPSDNVEYKGKVWLFKRAILGFTTIELVCSGCGDIQFRTTAGDQS